MKKHSKQRLSVEYLKTKSGRIGSASEISLLRDEGNQGEHYLTPDQLANVFRTDLNNGLTSGVAKELLESHGPNELKKLHGDSYFKLFRRNLFGWFQCVLWIGAFLNFFAYHTADYLEHGGGHSKMEYLYLGIVITATIVCTGLFGFYQEAKNLAVMSAFDKLLPPVSTVIRDGMRQQIPNNELVIGDIVEMSHGEIVPADCRILTCSNFKTDMASLTGESQPVHHRPYNTHNNPLESKNMIFFSCPITEGSARAMVIATGELTQIGKIAGLVTGLKKDTTPLAKEITHFIKLICIVAFIFGLIFFVMVFIIQGSWMAALQYMLGIILANVPEGLLVTLTVCMTLSAKQLKKKNCLAKSLQAVETLGSTSCICSDKTGTLTINRMSVSHLFTNLKIFDKDDHAHVAEPAYATLCLAACLNLRAEFTPETLHLPLIQRKILGDASESAILRYMEANRSASEIREINPKIAEIPFSSVYKYQITIHWTESQYHLLIMKGAPEIIVEHCKTYMINEHDDEIDSTTKKQIKENFIALANKGERVIGYAVYHLPVSDYPRGFQFDTQDINFPLDGLVFVGAISMIDPPRENVHKYIRLCREAGIKVIMVTGDHPVTALSISKACNIITKPTAYDYAFEHHIDVSDVPTIMRNQFEACIISGDELRKMTAKDLQDAQLRYDEITFARTSPQQKLFIVENYQALGYIVAVTGDGVNDSPALKKADIGVAMGITGTEVSKQAADMILLDDNFASIVLGVKEGRRIFDNLKKTIAYTLTSNTPEMLPFVVYACFGMPLPLTLILILVINVGTDLLPAMSLAYEDSEMDIMKIPPRKPNDHLVTGVLIFMAYFQIGLIQFFGSLYSYYVVMAEAGFFPSKLMFIREAWDNHHALLQDTLGRSWTYEGRKVIERKAQTAYFVSLCWTQISDVIICKTRRVSLIKKGMRNHVLNMSILVDLIAACIVTYVPVCQQIFGTAAIEYYNFFTAVPFMALMIIGDEFRRYLIRNNLSSWTEKEIYY